MKKTFTLLFLLGLCCGASISAQTFHSILFTDSQDKSIGVAARASHDYYSGLLCTIETSLGSSYNSATPIDKNGYDCSKTDLLQVLDNLTCEENDIVVFIYIGHGARAQNDPSNFPQMCFAVPQGSYSRDGDDFFPLESVRNIIMKKNPRFCLVIGDCCNSCDPNLSVKDPITEAQAMVPDIILRQGENAIKKLFLSQRGSVILTASVKGEYGWSITKHGYGFRLGTLLERILNNVFQDIKNAKITYSSWDNLLDVVKAKTYNLSKSIMLLDSYGRRWTQTPYYETKLEEASIIDKRKPIVEAKDLQQALKQVADSRSFSDTERIAKSRALKAKYFDGDNAMIEVVGKDMKTIVESTDIRKYLLRAATESDLANLTILEQRKDDKGKVIYLKIHEIYVEPSQD